MLKKMDLLAKVLADTFILSKISKKASFYSLRDASGMMQLIVRRSEANGLEDALAKMSRTPEESVVSVQGRVKLRPQSSKVCNVDQVADRI